MEKLKVLIVEDEAIAAMALEMELAAFDPISVQIVSSGEDAIALTGTFNPDLIFMDVYLDGPMNGIDAIKKIHALKKIPVVYTTASQSIEVERQINSTDFIGFLQKPYLTAEIQAIMHSFNTR
jgi:two-component system, response regulator PdtaR